MGTEMGTRINVNGTNTQTGAGAECQVTEGPGHDVPTKVMQTVTLRNGRCNENPSQQRRGTTLPLCLMRCAVGNGRGVAEPWASDLG